MRAFDQIKAKLERHGLLPAGRPGKSIISILIQDLIRTDVLKQASVMAYVTLVSLVPSLVAVFAVIALFSPMLGDDSTLVDQLRGFVLNNLTPSSAETVVGYLERMLSRLDVASLGWSAFASVMVSLILLLRQIEEALNQIFLVRASRNPFTRFMYFWTFLSLGALVLGFSVGAASGFDLQAFLEPGNQGGLRGTLTALFSPVLFFFVVYKVVPNCVVSTRGAAAGALVAGFAIHIGSRTYGIFIRNAGNYETIYGALAALPLFLLWIYIAWVIILLGALLAWRLHVGFPQDDEKDTLDHARTPRDRFRNLQVRSILPQLTLLEVHRLYETGKGHGITSQTLGDRLKIPMQWIDDALQTLKELNYVIVEKQDDDSLTDYAGDHYFPARPATSISLKDLTRDLDSPLVEWLDHHREDEAIAILQQVRRDLEAGSASDDHLSRFVSSRKSNPQTTN